MPRKSDAEQASVGSLILILALILVPIRALIPNFVLRQVKATGGVGRGFLDASGERNAKAQGADRLAASVVLCCALTSELERTNTVRSIEFNVNELGGLVAVPVATFESFQPPTL